MKDQIESVKNDYLRAKAGLLHALATTPDDRLTWSPTPTARSPLHQAVHAVDGIRFVQDFINGQPFAGTTQEADRQFRDFERTVSSRDGAIRLIESRSSAFLAWLDDLDEAGYASQVPLPFGKGSIPMAFAITLPASHIQRHHAQLDYIQSAYGDYDWYF